VGNKNNKNMFCSNCGNTVSDNAVICVRCGASLSNANQRRPSTANGRCPKTWLIESILVTLFCCLPFGIAGIVNATKVESLFNVGDVAGAESASSSAQKWTLVSLCVGIGVYVLVGVISIIGAATEEEPVYYHWFWF
jgi:hypothetical protein